MAADPYELARQTDDDLVDAAWAIAAAPASIRARVADGWYPVMHECIAPPCWVKDGMASEDLTIPELRWFAGHDNWEALDV